MNLNQKYENEVFNSRANQQIFEKYLVGETRQLAFGYLMYCQLNNVGPYMKPEVGHGYDPRYLTSQVFTMPCPYCNRKFAEKELQYNFYWD